MMRSTASVPTADRILQLDGLRALAIIAVLIHHTFRTPLLWAGVDVFFVLSGFLITGILVRKKEEKGRYFSYFYERRAFRIIPAYVTAICFAGLLFGFSVFHPWYAYVLPLMNMSSIAQGGTGLPLWSLAVEEQFYLVWPFFVLKASERTLLRLALAAVVLTPLLRFVATPFFPTHYSIYYQTPFRADLLCAGAALALAVRQNSEAFGEICRKRAWIGCFAGFGLLAASQASPQLRLINNTRSANAIVYSLTLWGSVCLLAWALYGRGILNRVLMLKPVRFIGRISYSMYLVGTLIRVIILRHTSRLGVVLLLDILITILWATISWYAVERPMLNLGSRLTARRRKLKPLFSQQVSAATD